MNQCRNCISRELLHDSFQLANEKKFGFYYRLLMVVSCLYDETHKKSDFLVKNIRSAGDDGGHNYSHTTRHGMI